MTPMHTPERSEQQLRNCYSIVAHALDMRRHESLAMAAFRCLRLNIDSETVQEVARRVCAMSGRAPREQWQVVTDCAALLAGER